MLVATLAIEGYDTLPASLIVPRLSGLAPAELEAIRLHEGATRRRRTILARISQLESERIAPRGDGHAGRRRA